MVPGDTHEPFQYGSEARQVLNEAEEELRTWQPSLEPVHSNAGHLGTSGMPGGEEPGTGVSTVGVSSPPTESEFASPTGASTAETGEVSHLAAVTESEPQKLQATAV